MTKSLIGKKGKNIQLSTQDITHETVNELLKSITELNCTCYVHIGTCHNCIMHTTVIRIMSITT